MALIVAIDGPAGSGKSTVARALAQRLGLLHLDTGAVYRTVAVRALEHGVDLSDEAALIALAEGVTVEARDGVVLIDGRVPDASLRTRDAGIAASKVSVHPRVRAVLVAKQRAVLEPAGGVAEGRDIGTVVAPDATLKLFLVASPVERARRRLAEHAEDEQALEALAVEIAERDARDESRPSSPLRAADDAIRIDTTGRDPGELIEEALRLLAERGIAAPGTAP